MTDAVAFFALAMVGIALGMAAVAWVLGIVLKMADFAEGDADASQQG